MTAGTQAVKGRGMPDGGEVLGEHVLLEVVGTGTDSVVHRARQRDRGGRIVAIKRLRVDARPDAVARLRREAALLAGLAHPAIMPLLDVVDDPGPAGSPDGDGVALVLPWAPGGSLEEVLRRDGALSWPRVADLGARLASALASAHATGVLHRDVKPANVLLGAEDEPRLADFGTALLRADASDDVVGTAEYLDPAVAVDGDAPSGRSDQYALGVLLYRALSGQLPHAGGSPDATVVAAARGVPPALAELVADVPATLVAAVERAMARAPEGRFASVQQLQSVLDGLVSDHEAATWDQLGSQLARPSKGRGDDTAPPPPAAAGAPASAAAPSAPPASAVPGDNGTRLFGPRPPVVEDPTDDPARPRWAAPALVAIALVPVLVLAWLVLLRPPDPGPPEAVAPSPTSTSASPTARVAPPRCEGVEPPAVAEVLEADVDGRGCALPLAVAEEDVDGQPALVLTVPDEAGEAAGRYAVGAPGDRVVVGDWDACDGSDTPAVVRPDGSTFLFDGYGALESEPGPTIEAGSDPRVVTGPDGCDRITD